MSDKSAKPKVGPSGGYWNGRKNHYRRDIWAFVDDRLGIHARHHVPRNERRVFILDEATGYETFELLRRGYQPENIHVCNEAPDQVAVLQRRVRKASSGRSIRTYGCDVSSALTKARDQGVSFHAINLDSTWKITIKALARVHSAAEALALSNDGGAVLAVNVFKGREDIRLELQAAARRRDINGVLCWWPAGLNKITHGGVRFVNIERLQMLSLAVTPDRMNESGWSGRCVRNVEAMRWGTYQSERSPMLWCAMHVTAFHDCRHHYEQILGAARTIERDRGVRFKSDDERAEYGSFCGLFRPSCLQKVYDLFVETESVRPWSDDAKFAPSDWADWKARL